MDVIDEIAKERSRQVWTEGWSPKHDDEHRNGELLRAAISYASIAATAASVLREGGSLANYIKLDMPRTWPWDEGWWKPKSPRRDLVRAAALIVAEIERLDRASQILRGDDNNG